jgi:hypothetical protein
MALSNILRAPNEVTPMLMRSSSFRVVNIAMSISFLKNKSVKKYKMRNAIIQLVRMKIQFLTRVVR